MKTEASGAIYELAHKQGEMGGSPLDFKGEQRSVQPTLDIRILPPSSEL